MFPVTSIDLGKAAIREVISLAALILDSGTLICNEGLSGAVFRGFGNMVFEWGINMILERGMMVSVVLNVMCFEGFDCTVTVSNSDDGFLLGKLKWRMPKLLLVAKDMRIGGLVLVSSKIENLFGYDLPFVSWYTSNIISPKNLGGIHHDLSMSSP